MSEASRLYLTSKGERAIGIHLPQRTLLTQAGLLSLLISCLVILPAGRLFAQSTPLKTNYELAFERITFKEGLASNKVISVAQDQQGFIWIGTQEGLHRYDGYELLTFQHDPNDTTSLSNSSAESIYVDRFGTIWVGTWDGINRYDPIKRNFKRYSLDYSTADSKFMASVHAIVEDKDDQLWIATGFGGVFRYAPEEDAFIPYPHISDDPQTISFNSVSILYVDREGTLWAGTGSPWDHLLNRGGLNRYDPERDAFTRFEHNPADPTSLQHNEISSLYEDSQGNFWVATWEDGLYLMDRKTETFSAAPKPGESNPWPKWTYLRTINGPSGTIKSFHEDKQGVLWIGNFNGGLDRYDPATETINNYFFEPDTPTSLSDNIVWSIFEDRQNILWLATWQGLSILKPQRYAFELVGQNNKTAAVLHNSHVEEILIDRHGNIFTGTWKGLGQLNSTTNTYQQFKSNLPGGNQQNSEMVVALHEDQQGTIWAGTRSYGLARFDPMEGLVFVHSKDTVEQNTLSIYSILEDSEGEIWVAGGQGVFKFDAQKGVLQPLYDQETIPPERRNVHVLDKGKENEFWIVSGSGLDKLNPAQGKITPFYASSSLNNMLADDDGSLWLGTIDERLLHFDPTTKEYQTYAAGEGLPGVVRGLIKDDQNRLWISTTKGLGWLEEGADQILSFAKDEAPAIHEFYPHAVAKDVEGNLLFGGNGGIIRFNPATVGLDTTPPIPFITGLRLFNNLIDSALVHTVDDSGQKVASIRLAHQENDLTFEFTGLHFIRPEANKYRYLLENYEEDWRYVGEQKSAIYPNLPPGEYTFKVQSANPDGIWSTKSAEVRVNIRPPWWKTKVAVGAFALLLLGGFFLINRWQRQRLREAERKRASLLEAELRANAAETQAQQFKALDESKARLYANITHEFRTPLTVIMGMVDNIRGHQQERKLIQRNSQNLLRLINQLLDLSKLEADAMQIDFVQGDIIVYLQYLTESFYSMAKEKDIRLLFYPEVKELVMDFDERIIQHIVYNLLSNALKFTSQNGRVVLHANQVKQENDYFLQLKVQDTGIGISPDQIDHIFDRFYQADNSSTRKGEGTGIGLALTKELVKILGGHITVESTLGQGSLFTLQIPVKKQIGTPIKKGPLVSPSSLKVDAEINHPKPIITGFAATNGEKPLLLIIEDNVDVVTYIVGLLEASYTIATAGNGRIGIEKAVEIIPDIIISDVMMPEKDGYEVCQTLKQDERTSHIPIILLTAKATVEDRMGGLKVGADAYLIKPFHKEELLVRLEKLIGLRKTLQAHYAEEEPFSKSVFNKPTPSLEDLFLQKLVTVVQERIDDPDLGVVHLCRAANRSNTQVNRKLKALTGRTPSQFIRSIRLQRAADLLETTELNVSEAAYAVGFNDPNYFTRTFSEEFGFPPSDVRK